MRKKNYRLECESVDPKICEAITRVRILPEDCSTPAKGCSHTNGFKIETCPCSGQCFDGNSCQSSTCPCNSVDCSDLSSHTPSLLDHIKKSECVCTGDTPCMTDYTRAKCDVCDLRKDKPQMLTLRWVANAGAQSSITFESGTCGTEQILADSNEVVLEASCFDYGEKLPTNIHYKVDGSDYYLHASCSQPLNVGDVVYNDPNKGSLIVVGFRSVTGRTEHNCPGAKFTCGSRSYTAPSLSCDAGISLTNPKSAKGVDLTVDSDSTVQYMWDETQHGGSSSWTDEFEYTAVSCDGEKVNAKITITVETPWVKDTTGKDCTEVALGSSRKTANAAECTKSCEETPDCKRSKFRKKGWCAHYGTRSCKKGLNSNPGVAMMETESERETDLSILHGVTDVLLIVMIVHSFCAFSFQ